MESNGRGSLGSGVIYQYVAASVFMVSGTAFFIFLTKTQSTADVGNVSLLLAIVQLFHVALSLGLKPGMEHYLSFYAGRNEPGTIRKILIKYGSFTAVLSFSAFLIPFLLAPDIALLFYHSAAYTRIIQFVSIDIAAAMAFSVLNGMITGLQHFETSGRIYMITAVLVYGLATVFLLFFHSFYLMILGWIIGYIFGIGSYALYILAHVRLVHDSGNSVPIREMLRYSSPVLVSTLLLFGSLYIDRLIVAVFLTLSYLGIYNLAVQIAQGVAFFINPLNNVLLPKFSEMFSRNDTIAIREGVRFSTNILTLFYTPLALGIAAIAPDVLVLLGNTSYLPSTIPLMILLSSSSMFITQYVLVQALTGTRRTTSFLLATSLSFIANMVASIFLIPRFGLIGASVSNSLAPAVSFTAILVLALRAKIVMFDVQTVSRIWISSVSMAIFVVLTQYVLGQSFSSAILSILVGLLTFPVLLKFLKGVKRSDMEQLINLFPTRSEFLHKVLLGISSA